MERNDWVDSARAMLDPNVIVESRVSGRPIEDVLFVDSSIELQRTVQAVLRSLTTVHCCSTFEDACSRLISSPPDLLITGVRLHAHNGIHLVYLAARSPRTRSIVYLASGDWGLAREVEAARAFAVREPWLAITIESLVRATLSPRDRRDALTLDRRRHRLGGRRYTDTPFDDARNLASGNRRPSEPGWRTASSHH